MLMKSSDKTGLREAVNSIDVKNVFYVFFILK